jgi:hypothetical protein
VLVGLSISTEVGVAVLGLYIFVQWLVATFVAPRIERRAVAMHPAVLATVVVALSQFGLVWVLLAGPAAAVARDLFRYVYGRFGDPPRPAGLLPGEVPAASRQTALARRRIAVAPIGVYLLGSTRRRRSSA